MRGSAADCTWAENVPVMESLKVLNRIQERRPYETEVQFVLQPFRLVGNTWHAVRQW